ncbi:FkpA FKBP-type peptidyl-prolyl cis-trans isomerases 1 [actinobacterium SCGC AAA044-D11]|uniref:peptidylprolyl isomerase n=1 Tax=freshwater metagenome TaxID=449393 RepID=A0A6J6GV36_9ZZZZ
MLAKRPSILRKDATFAFIGALLLTTSLTGCTLDGGTGSANKEKTMASTEREYMSVSNEAGVEPKIGQPSGDAPMELVSRDIIVGDGIEALPSSTLTVQYVLISWKTGKVLQSSWSGQPAIFPLSGVIQGWQQGIPGMKVGGRRLLVIPPDLAYGASGSGPIGPNETLAFVVDLVNVN